MFHLSLTLLPPQVYTVYFPEPSETQPSLIPGGGGWWEVNRVRLMEFDRMGQDSKAWARVWWRWVVKAAA